MKKLYVCDPQKNKECSKESCFLFGGECYQTTEEKYRLRRKHCEICGKEIKQLCEVDFEIDNILVGVYYLCPECGKKVMKFIDFKKATNAKEYGE